MGRKWVSEELSVLRQDSLGDLGSGLHQGLDNLLGRNFAVLRLGCGGLLHESWGCACGRGE